MMKKPIILNSGEGRRYDLGSIKAVFKADEDETDSLYSVSEWWLEPATEGVGAHSHDDNDEIFYVLEGRPSLLIGETWSDQRAGLLNVFIPGGFERNMPSIETWFRDHRP
jgi:mannose-6-phosphate isomerase-like protein (cupin superfamily)